MKTLNELTAKERLELYKKALGEDTIKIYELPSGEWMFVHPVWYNYLPIDKWRQIDPDPTVAHTLELESCTAVITKDSCYFRDAAAPVLSLEEMQRVTKCMEMLREAQR